MREAIVDSKVFVLGENDDLPQLEQAEASENLRKLGAPNGIVIEPRNQHFFARRASQPEKRSFLKLLGFSAAQADKIVACDDMQPGENPNRCRDAKCKDSGESCQPYVWYKEGGKIYYLCACIEIDPKRNKS